MSLDLTLCPGVDSTAGGKDIRCHLCIRLATRWPRRLEKCMPVYRLALYDPARLAPDGSCASLILGHPDEVPQ
jgi:hypothetical protein